MSHQNYMKVSGVLFLAIALVHLWRVINVTPVAFGTSFIPMWASYIAIVVGGYLSYHALKKR
ncbi:MAG: hypothetical protein ACYCY6_01925 [Minisyncoccota bacterium]